MPFILDNNPSPNFPYTVQIPSVGDSGAQKLDPLKIKFKRMSRTEMLAIRPGEGAEDGIQADLDFVLTVADGWDAVDSSGQPVPFDADNVRTLIDKWPRATMAIIEAFYEANLHGGEKRKN